VGAADPMSRQPALKSAAVAVRARRFPLYASAPATESAREPAPARQQV
jgi:hypothetical protein